MSITIRGRSWSFPSWSLKTADVFPNKLWEVAKMKLNGVNLDNQDQKDRYIKDKCLTYIADNFEGGEWIDLSVFMPYGLYYVGAERDGSKFLVYPGLIEEMTRFILTRKNLAPGDEDEFNRLAGSEWFDRNRSNVVFLDGYMSKSNFRRIGDMHIDLHFKVIDDIKGWVQNFKDQAGQAKKTWDNPLGDADSNN